MGARTSKSRRRTVENERQLDLFFDMLGDERGRAIPILPPTDKEHDATEAPATRAS